MNIAITIGIAEYDSLGSLPACRNDIQIIEEILKSSRKYDRILVLDDNHTPQQGKQKIVDLVQQYRDNEIEELFFYYSGHGDFDGNEFYYLWKNYNEKIKRQSSLENTEVDNLLRVLKPKVIVKIIDACHSGISYIKDESKIEDYLKGTQSYFSKCFFLFSSMKNQSSFASKSISNFTKSFVNSLGVHDVDMIRFKSIIDYISDDFETKQQQTPFFVIQADFTESFVIANDEFKNEIRNILNKVNNDSLLPKTTEPQSLTQIVSADAEKYCTQEEALDILHLFKEHVDTYTLKSELNNLYHLNIETDTSYETIPQKEIIAKWVEENSHKIFAKVNYILKTKTERVPKNPMALGITFFGTDDDQYYKTVTKKYNDYYGFESKADQPYSFIKLKLSNNYPNINPYDIYLIPLLSKTDVYIFYSIVKYTEKEWNDYIISNEPTEWMYKVIPLKTDNFKDYVDDIIESCLNEITEDLEIRFQNNENPPKEDVSDE